MRDRKLKNTIAITFDTKDRQTIQEIAERLHLNSTSWCRKVILDEVDRIMVEMEDYEKEEYNRIKGKIKGNTESRAA